MRHFTWVSGVAVVLGLVIAASAQQKSVTDPAKADADFAIQGEYSGEVELPDGRTKVGSQVIALGSGKFRAVFYIGGLPGDGWEKETGKQNAEGELANGVVTFNLPDAVAKVKDGVMTGTDLDGKELGSIKKIVRKSPTLGAKAPDGAIILFDGKKGDEWQPGTTDGQLLAQGQTSKRKFKSGKLHIEFMLPYEPAGRDQGRGNSGCYLQGRYEVQILDSFGLEGKNNEAGGIYSISDPAVNMCFPPLSWQTYDIDFTAAEYDAAGKKTKNARMTVHHNGVLVQDNVEVPRITTAAPVQEGAEPGPIYLQDHGHPVRFRNIWFVAKE